MKKKDFLIGIGIILLVLIVWGIKRQIYICGDGVCHQKKEFRTDICSKDCGGKTQNIPDVENSNQPYACYVKSIEKIGTGSFPKWSPDGTLIAFNKLVDNVYEIFVMKPDGSGVKCLTCNKLQLPKRGHKGQPYWHPNGKYLVFTVQNTDYKPMLKGYAEQPDVGRNHNVWIMTADGSQFWQMTDYPENWGVIKPTFSNDGTKIFWNEEFMMEKYPRGKWIDIIPHSGSFWNPLNYIFRRGEELGAWRVVYADLYFDGEIPEIENIQKLNPPKDFTLIEASGFIPNNNGFICSYADLKRIGWRGLWGDIYTMDLKGTNMEQLTFSAYNHDENAEYSPDGQKIVWSSSVGEPGRGGIDLYLMDANGKNKARLTYFGEKSSKKYLGDDYSCRELGWSPDGKKLVFSFGTNYRPYLKDQSYYFDNLYLLTFAGSCGKLSGSHNTLTPTINTLFPEKLEIQVVSSKSLYRKGEKVEIQVTNNGLQTISYYSGPGCGLAFEYKVDTKWRSQHLCFTCSWASSKAPCILRTIAPNTSIKIIRPIEKQIPSGTYRAVFSYIDGRVYSEKFQIL